MLFLVLALMSCVSPLVSLSTFLMSANSLFGAPVMILVSVMFPLVLSIIAQVRTHVRFHLPLFFKGFKSTRQKRYFHRQWGARGVVASVDAGQLTLCL